MKVLILTEGGKDIGFGHITRCVSLYQTFEEKGIRPEFVISGDISIEFLLEVKNFQIFDWVKEEKKVFRLVRNSNITIIDSYLAGISYYEEISRLTGIPVYIDDTKRLDYPPGIIINGNIYAERLHYPRKDKIACLLGTKYVPLRKEFQGAYKMKINKEVKNILVTFGGMNYSFLIHKIVNYLQDKFNFNFHSGDSYKKKLRSKEMLNLMLEADICISGGGQTTYELARLGIPTIGICFAENQRLNLEGWHQKGFIEYIGWFDDINLLKKIECAINKFMSYEERFKRNNMGLHCVDGKGTERILRKLFEG